MARALAVFPRLAFWALRDARDAARLLENFSHWAAAFREAAASASGLAALAQLVRYVSLVTDDMHYEQFRAKMRELAPQAEQAVMTIAEELRQEGRQEGRREGRQETLLKLLRLKFGDLSPARVSNIEAADRGRRRCRASARWPV
jgi:flagellar biosynthesis/type III secretory pathway protein FliH